MALRVAELETVFTGNTKAFEASATKVEKARTEIAKAKAEVEVTADTKGAMAGMDRVETKAQSLTKGEILIEAVTAGARSELGRLEDDASSSGKSAGEGAGKGLSAGIIGALATIPIAGAVVGIGAAIGKSLMDGLQVEVRSDILTARTGLDEATVAKVARVAGEAYANNFGESISANMDTARVAIQGGLLDPAATARDSQTVIESLQGVADIIGEEIAPVAKAAAQLIRTGLAKDSAAAFDIIVKGQQAGVNVGEDMLDTFNEYGTQFRKLGLEGPQALGLMSQAIKAGARDSDIAADAFKEFSIRAVDGSVLTAASFEAIGLNADEMTRKIAAGGPEAAGALDQTLDRLRAIEDPALRAQTAVALFGTQAEDLGDALYAMDLTTAIDQLGTVAGVAQTAVDAMGDNAAGSIATAQRNIEVAADGIKGALATAFNPQIEGFATFVSENREAVMTFLLDLANGGFDAGRGLVNGMASGTEAVGAFISGPIADLVDALGDVVLGIDAATPGDQGGKAFREWADGAVAGLRTVEDSTGDLADEMRDNLITNGIDVAQDKLNEVAIPMIAQAAIHDASMRLAKSIDSVGYAADGSTLLVDGLTIAADGTARASTELDTQLRAVATGLQDQTDKGIAAGETQEALTTRYNEGRDALILQLEQMGLTTEQAGLLADSYGAVPSTVATTFEAATAAAQTNIDDFITRNTGKVIKLTAEVSASGNPVYKVTATGAKFEAAGDVLSMRPMGKMAAVVPPGTLRVIGDRMDVDESFIPHDGSARSLAILDETMRRMLGYGIKPMADGGVVAAGVSPVIGQQSRSTIRYDSLVTIGSVTATDPQGVADAVGREFAYALIGKAL